MNSTASLEVSEQVSAVRHGVGIWHRREYTFIRFEGNGVASWLQTQTSNDVVALQSGQGHANALLDRKGRLQAHFTLHRWENEYWLLIEKQQAQRLLEQLEAHIFLEDVRMADAGDEVDQIVVQGPRTLAMLASLLDTAEITGSDLLPREWNACHPIQIGELQLLAFRISTTGEDGYIFVTQTGEGRVLVDLLAQHGARLVSEKAQEALRIEAGLPRFGLDMDTSNRISETTLERHSVSYTKGCYLGQEVVAKLRAYSSVKTALVGLSFDNDCAPPPDTKITVNGSVVGEVRSGAFSPTLNKFIALAYLDREHRTPDSLLSFTNGDADVRWAGRVAVLPFYAPPSREERARSLYDEALIVFERDTHDQDDRAIELLREAVLLHPTFEDAYEALGVILNRHHRVDEAIHFMRILARLNPDCVMAHTNLSVFYMTKGMIDEAETEKAQAAVLQMRRARESKRAEEIAAEERERIRREAVERIGMFEQVLEFDPDDALATFGTGMAYMQLQEFVKAIPFLERATKVQKDYSVAFLNLGKCCEFSGRLEQARAAYQAGIESAGRKGDLMPMREMQRRLKAMEETASIATDR